MITVTHKTMVWKKNNGPQATKQKTEVWFVKKIQKYGDTKVIIISRKSTDRHYNGQNDKQWSTSY
jgi:hypothetical protein